MVLCCRKAPSIPIITKQYFVQGITKEKYVNFCCVVFEARFFTLLSKSCSLVRYKIASV